jgi:Zn-dependent metalloprotease
MSVAANGPSNSHSKLKALTGKDASEFSLPADTKLKAKDKLKQGTAERHAQFVNGAQVLGGQLTIFRDETGKVTAVIGKHYPNLLSTNSVKLKSDAAKSVAAKRIGGAGKWKTDLMIDPNTGRFFYRVENQRDDSRWFHWVDAETGAVINAYNGLAHGSGIGVTGDVKDLTGLTRANGSGFELVSPNGRISTHDAGNRKRLPGSLATDDNDTWNREGTTSPAQPALVDAHFYANQTDNYYSSVHGFNWTDYYSQGIRSSAHVQRNYNNAYWNGVQMSYGDGDGSTFIELSGDLDVVGHELTHGVTDATSNLIYQNESGALNEAFSDIMGTNIEFYNGTGNWTIGEDIEVNGNGIRNMADPGEDSDPSHYGERYTGTSDNGGVHINSGIINHWYYLLTMGGQNADSAWRTGNSVTGIGLATAEALAYATFTSLPANATFCDARAASIALAGNHATNVTDAWDEVGVTGTFCSGGDTGVGDPSGDAPVITNVTSQDKKGTKFVIRWTTGIASDSEVTFTCCGTYINSSLVTSHRMQFTGSKGVLYEYYVSSAANGQKTTAGPYLHQN